MPQMKRTSILLLMIAFSWTFAHAQEKSKSAETKKPMSDKMKTESKGKITHTVQLKFKAEVDAEQQGVFFAAADKLKNIPGVKHFEVMRQVSSKNQFQYLLSMVFDNDEIYQQYNQNPVHLDFIEKQWKPKVESFLEADFVEP
jgi:heme-degrading monooxygenase HmoA